MHASLYAHVCVIYTCVSNETEIKTLKMNNFSEHSGDVVGFDSTWEKDKQVQVRDSGTDAMESTLEFTDKSSFTQETSDIAVSLILRSLIFTDFP